MWGNNSLCSGPLLINSSWLAVLPLWLYFLQITIEKRLLLGASLIGMTWLISTWVEQQCPFGPSGNTIFEQTKEKTFPNSEPIACFEEGDTLVLFVLLCQISPLKIKVKGI